MIRSKGLEKSPSAVFIVVKFGGGADKFGAVGGGTDMLGKLIPVGGGGFAN
ncbi:GSCOCG00008856001-RA-CDS [Cotesia congregata]|nr:GSCOCG00008856001-RA-CDS [Cotesia congregata]